MAVFVLSGLVKGVIGMGLPAISLGLLTLSLDLSVAMPLVIMPSLVTNFWQACLGGYFLEVVRRIWAFLLPICLTISLGTGILVSVDESWLSGTLGVLLGVYAVIAMFGWQIRISRQRSMWLGPLVGAVNGTITGMTGSFIVPGVIYLQALGMKKDMLVQAMGIAFLTSTIILGLSLQQYGIMRQAQFWQSCLAIIPALIGMQLGMLIRARVSELRFRMIFLVGMLLIGMAILFKSVWLA